MRGIREGLASFDLEEHEKNMQKFWDDDISECESIRGMFTVKSFEYEIVKFIVMIEKNKPEGCPSWRKWQILIKGNQLQPFEESPYGRS